MKALEKVHVAAFVALAVLFTVTKSQKAPAAQGDNTVVVSSAEELRGALASNESNRTIRLNITTIAEPLGIDFPGIVLEGGRTQPSVLRCPQSPNASSALTVRGVSASIRFIEFSRCKGQSAVSIETPVGSRNNTFEVSFERVSFTKNGGRSQLIRGAAVRADACKAQSCAKLSLNFASCSFRNNLATYGGAIYLEDGELRISESEFLGNEADLNGGAVYIQRTHSTTITVQGSRFEMNVAHNDLKLHLTDEAGLLETSNTTLRYVGMGGAVFALDADGVTISESSFTNNRGCRGGGAVGALHLSVPHVLGLPPTFDVSDSLFEANRAFCGHKPRDFPSSVRIHRRNAGGALMYEIVTRPAVLWKVQRSIFVRNAAIYGGGISIDSEVHSETEHLFVSTRLAGNNAVYAGGNVFVNSARITATSCNFTDGKATYGAGVMVRRNAVFSVLRNADNPSSLSYVESNTATYNSGISAHGLLNLTALVIRNNTSFTYGGGINNYVGRSVFRGIIVEENRSLAGGGIRFARQTNVTISSDEFGSPTIIRNNVAVVGGGVFFESAFHTAFTMTVTDTVFEANRALLFNSSEIMDLVESSANFDPCAEANVIYPNVSDHLTGDALLDFLLDMPIGHGGGVALSLTSVELFSVAEIIFQNVRTSGNEALVGGGLSVFFTDVLWNRGEAKSCFPAANGLDVCQRFVFVNVTVTDNRARYAGGIFSTLPDGISVACSPTNQSRFNISLLQVGDGSITDHLKPFCSTVTNNSIADSNKVDGADMGTRAEYLEIEASDSIELRLASGDPLTVPCPGNTNERCPLRILVKDAFNQTIVTGIEDANLELMLVSGMIRGASKYSARDGVAVINSTFARGVNRTSTITVVSERNPRVRIQIGLVTRPCLPGESERQAVCAQCQRDQYGFRPDLKCKPCEVNGVCDGKAALVPASGYWHSNPFSPVFRQCIQPAACNYEDRHQNLSAFYQNDTRVTQELEALDAYLEGAGTRPEFPEYRQCTEGYEGILCGSCSPGYGHSFTGACKRCPDTRSRTSLLLLFRIASIVLIVGVNCWITMSSMNTRVQVTQYEVHRRTRRRNRVLQKNRPFAMSSRMLARITGQHPQSYVGIPVPNRSHLDQLAILSKQLDATVQLSGTFKVLMNYLQVTVVALSLQTEWNEVLSQLLGLEAGLAGLTNKLFSVPFECNISPTSSSASIIALWTRAAIPMIVLYILVFGFLAIWFVRKRNEKEGGEGETESQHTPQRLLTCLIVICIVTVYFSYIDLVKELLRTVNCVRLENAEEIVAADHSYIDYAVETGGKRVWAEDTHFVCFEGKHLPVGLVGIGGLLVSLAFIVLIVVWVPLNRQHATNTEFIARYWFLYEGYRDEWYTRAWESTILARKAMIAAVVVFSSHLGPSLQGAMCSGLLFICLVLQNTVAPFKVSEDQEHVPEYAGYFWRALCLPKLAEKWTQFNNRIHLNTLETASLAGSILVFYYAVVLHDSNSSRLGRTAMVTAAFGFNAILSLYMLYRLYSGCHVLIDIKLELANPSFLETHRRGMNPFSLLFKWIVWIGGQLSAQNETLNGV